MRTVFMGTPGFAVPSLRALCAGHEVNLVITQPDKPAGRGRELKPPPVKVEATRLKLPLLQTNDANHPDVLAVIQEMRPQVIVVVAYGCILRRELLETPSVAPVNLHASLLPKYRGMSPINRAVMHGETVTGVTTMRMDEGVDTGPILLQREVPIGDEETAGELSERLARTGAELLLETVDRLEAGDLQETPQDDAQATYAPRLKKSDGLIPWEKPAKQVADHIRGVTPWPGATTYLEGAALKVLRARALPDAASVEGASPGTVVGVTAEGPAVQALEGQVVLLEVCPQGRKPMSGDAWARGKRSLLGAVFSSKLR